VAHSLLVTAYHVLAHQTTYHELGADYYDRHHTERLTRRALHTLEQQGYRVTLERTA
jgi:transposase